MNESNARILKVDPRDNVLVALEDLQAGEQLRLDRLACAARQPVPARHKLAARDLSAGERVVMYGVEVGRAKRTLRAGEWITTENVAPSQEPAAEYAGRVSWSAPDVSGWAGRTFRGVHRPDGRVGTANHWIVVPLVFCENRNVQVLEQVFGAVLGTSAGSRYETLARGLLDLYRSTGDAEALLQAGVGEEPGGESRRWPFPNVDGLRFLPHAAGCGGTYEDAAALCGLIAGYIAHPNVAGATVLSLGCQKATAALLREAVEARTGAAGKPARIFDQQEYGTQEKLLEEAVRYTLHGLALADRIERRPAPLSRLVLGVECGGSDGFSGISANPAIGRTADLLVALGGSVLLSEFPEFAGSESSLLERCVSRELGEKFIRLQRAFAEQARFVGSGFDANLSAGNIRDGLITVAMKAAGAVRKGGTSPVVDVLDYTEPVRRPGLSLLCTPGGDGESVTAMVGSGATLVLFSTGLGTPLGDPVVPVIKVSSNSGLARRMPDIIDADAGTIISGRSTVEEKGAELLELCLGVAGGGIRPKAVLNGQNDFAPWKRGCSL